MHNAGNFPGDFANLAHHRARALHRGRVGQLHIAQQIAHILTGNKTLGRILHALIREHHQAAVHNQHDHAERQQFADDPGVNRAERIEGVIERGKRPGQQPIERPTDDHADHRAGDGHQVWQRLEPPTLRLQPRCSTRCKQHPGQPTAGNPKRRPRQRRR